MRTYNDILWESGLLSKEVKLLFKGPVDERILTMIGDFIEESTKDYEQVGKKLFRIFFELAQNISYYSAEKIKFKNKPEYGIGTVIIHETDDNYVMITGNPVFNENIIPVLEKCEFINTLDRDSLRKYKREERNRPQGVKGNAHIGLIQTALTSANPLDVEVVPINDNISLFSITVTISKK